MRFSHVSLAACLPVAALLSGCAMGTQSAGVATAANPLVRSIQGKAHGGQQPVSGGTIVVYTYGTNGYGSAGTALATGTTDQNGDFNISYTCPTSNPNVPTYILSVAGMPGLNQAANSAIVLGAGLGPCSASESGYVTINEISTTVLGYALSHFFSTAQTDGNTVDTFGSPGSTSMQAAIARVNNNLIPTLTDVANGYPVQSTSTFTNESSKILTIADILGACVNSAGPGSPACINLFKYTTASSGQVPADTLQAVVGMALQPSQNVANLFSLVPPSGSSAFPGSLATQPNDWTIAVSYTNPALGLGIVTRTTSTLDIDTSGRVWFPSNAPGKAGVAYFDPSTASFSSLLATPGMVSPQQVVIDVNGTVWANDMQSDVVGSYSSASPGPGVPFILPGYTSTALTVDDDNSLRLSVVNTATNEPAFAQITALPQAQTYSLIPNSTPASSQYFIGASLAGDTNGGTGSSGTYLPTPTSYDYYISPGTSTYNARLAYYQNDEDSGQIIFDTYDYLVTRGGYNASDDGICSFDEQNCFAMNNQSALRHPTGLAIDGLGNLWLADTFTGDVQEVPSTNGNYLTSNALINNLVFTHDANNGGTMNTLAGIGIDATGNVWATNENCFGAGCTPGSFVLSEVIGAGAPTVTPVAAQVVLNTTPGTEPMAKSSSRMPK